MFNADVVFASDAVFNVGPMAWTGAGNNIKSEVVPASNNPNVFSFGPAMVHGNAGDSLVLNGTVTYEYRESGWVPVDIGFKFQHIKR
jgi:hypothetical protein